MLQSTYSYQMLGSRRIVLRMKSLTESDNLRHENDMLRTRLTVFGEVSRRISESLDIDTILQEVVDGACSLTNARYGALAVFDDLGQVRDFFTSGITPQERNLLGNLPKGLGLLGYLNEIGEPLRLSDIGMHCRSVGFPKNHPVMKTFLGMPIRHLGDSVGNIYLTEKGDGQEFTSEDERLLVMFSSQAAITIANALRYRDEQRARGDVETERQRLEALVNTSPIGVLVVDAGTRKVALVNQEAERIMGIPPEPGSRLERYQEASIYRRADGSKYQTEERPLSRALDHGETVRAEEILFDRQQGGGTISTLVNATPIYSEDGEIVSAVAVIHDMIPIQEMQRLRNEFLGMVSHELRTPLTTIKGATATALRSSPPPGAVETRQFFQIIDGQADHLRGLVNNLLDVTRIEAGILSVNPKPTDLTVLIDEAKDAFLRSGSSHRIESVLAPDLPSISGDARRIAQVLDNLLSNASKYSPESSTVTVTASQERFHVAVSVIDEGRGISVEHLPNLFRKFSRVGIEDDERKIAGDGLGLAICKGIVEAHGGRLWAESDGVGRGARFVFTIPVCEEVASDAAVDSAQELACGGRIVRSGDKLRVLAVDDEPQILRYVRNTLSEAGYTPIWTDNPTEVIHLLETDQLHLVLLDLVMPRISGFELMRRIRNVSDVPVIFLSGHDEEKYIVQALELGADDYITKPFSATELIARIKASLRKRGTLYQTETRKPYRLMDLAIDYESRRVTLFGQLVQLTETEYKLLFELSINAGRVLTMTRYYTESGVRNILARRSSYAHS